MKRKNKQELTMDHTSILYGCFFFPLLYIFTALAVPALTGVVLGLQTVFFKYIFNKDLWAFT